MTSYKNNRGHLYSQIFVGDEGNPLKQLLAMDCDWFYQSGIWIHFPLTDLRLHLHNYYFSQFEEIIGRSMEENN